MAYDIRLLLVTYTRDPAVLPFFTSARCVIHTTTAAAVIMIYISMLGPYVLICAVPSLRLLLYLATAMMLPSMRACCTAAACKTHLRHLAS
eukprot:3361114-Pleurochrysis_carterae.AAC.2